MFKNNSYTSTLFWLILISTLIRISLATFTELGNDEVYYRILSLFPQLSYYDHPPMIAMIIRLTTFGGIELSEFLVRFSSIIIGALNTYIIYGIARQPMFRPARDMYSSSSLTSTDHRRGLIAAVLYTTSLYASIIVGTFIMPDTPLSLFWLMAILLFTKILPREAHFNHLYILLAGIFIGCALLSKYTGAYLWGAAGLYILLYNRKLLTKWSLYVSILLSFAVFSPVIIWNIQNDFASFVMQGSRVVTGWEIKPLFFAREFFGAAFYNGIVNFALMLTAFCSYFIRRTGYISQNTMRFSVIFSLPMALLFLGVSLFNATLPHWSGPAYFGFMLIAAAYLNDKSTRTIRVWLMTAITFTLLVLTFAVVQINFGLFTSSNGSKSEPTTLGATDVSLDMYGWQQFSDKFMELYRSDLAEGKTTKNAVIIASKWYELSHLDAYLAIPNGLKLVALGDTEESHFYAEITKKRLNGADIYSQSGYYIVSSHIFNQCADAFSRLGIDSSKPYKVIEIQRGGETVQNFFIYQL